MEVRDVLVFLYHLFFLSMIKSTDIFPNYINKIRFIVANRICLRVITLLVDHDFT